MYIQHLGRLRILIEGRVQGVGFRPFVYRLAIRLSLSGHVRNTHAGVELELEGPPGKLEEALECLQLELPQGAELHRLHWRQIRAHGDVGFRVLGSDPTSPGHAPIPLDLATCRACVEEVLNPDNRRYRYAFTSCAACGPRYTILTAMPYDRANTTMLDFPMCGACQEEYDNPLDRRFHAQPIACPDCGPTLSLYDMDETLLAKGDAALHQVADAIVEGQIVALKSLGGFQLVCDARKDPVVARLRSRKSRPHKPFAVMVRNLTSARLLAQVNETEARLLESPQAPIVLVKPHPRGVETGVSWEVARDAPGQGIMLPFSPLHHLLLETLDIPIVCTSGNISEEPLWVEAWEVFQHLGHVADLVLTHNRRIAIPLDDSVARVVGGRPQVLRGARGMAPVWLPLPPGLPNWLLESERPDASPEPAPATLATGVAISTVPARPSLQLASSSGAAAANPGISGKTAEAPPEGSDQHTMPRRGGVRATGLWLLNLLGLGSQASKLEPASEGGSTEGDSGRGSTQEVQDRMPRSEEDRRTQGPSGRVSASPPVLKATGARPPKAMVKVAGVAYVPGILGQGGFLKSTTTLAHPGAVIVSPHIGDLTSARITDLRTAVTRRLRQLSGVSEVLAGLDAHPDYRRTPELLSGIFASLEEGVQHHQAHALAVVLEHLGGQVGLDELRLGRFLAVVWDGAGDGGDGTLHGGEFLLLTPDETIRVAHLRQFRLPGGDAAARDPLRCLLGLVHAAGDPLLHELVQQVHPPGLERYKPFERRALETTLEKALNAPWTSSVGRLFDAVAALLGFGELQTFEGQAAIWLETQAVRWLEKYPPPDPLPLHFSDAGELDWRPLLRSMLSLRAGGMGSEALAAAFHLGLVRSIVTAVLELASLHGRCRVVLAGGVFQNRLLLEGAIDALTRAGHPPLWSEKLPPNDGSLSAGQAFSLGWKYARAYRWSGDPTSPPL